MGSDGNDLEIKRANGAAGAGNNVLILCLVSGYGKDCIDQRLRGYSRAEQSRVGQRVRWETS
jgi:hypothetical protein